MSCSPVKNPNLLLQKVAFHKDRLLASLCVCVFLGTGATVAASLYRHLEFIAGAALIKATVCSAHEKKIMALVWKTVSTMRNEQTIT